MRDLGGELGTVLLVLLLAGVAVGGLWVRAGLHPDAGVLFALVVVGTVVAGVLPRGPAADRE